MKALTTKVAVHRLINAAAVDIANKDRRLQEYDFSRFGRVHESATANMFRPRATDGFGLEYDESWLENPLLQDKEEFIATMREIAVDAIKAALVKHGDLFVGVMVGEAREGRNYFGGGEVASRPPDSLF